MRNELKASQLKRDRERERNIMIIQTFINIISGLKKDRMWTL